MLMPDALSHTPYPLDGAEGIGRRHHDLALLEVAHGANRHDLVCWMQAEIKAGRSTMVSVADRATALLGADHPLVGGDVLGPAYVAARNGTSCR